jgi:heme/copper-type cytochrome/quinol oxidase subunit 2
MNTTESSPAKNTISLYTEQPASVSAAEEKDLTTNFYLVGGVINIVMISAYFIWAFRAWKKADKRKGQ